MIFYKKSIMLLLPIFLFTSCSSLTCTTEGAYKYCAPASSYKPNFIQKKSLDGYVESKELQELWLSSISKVANHLKKNNIPLYGQRIQLSSSQILSQNQKGSIKIEHLEENDIKITYPKGMPHFLSSSALSYQADALAIIRDARQLSKELSKTYLSMKQKVYISTEKIVPHTDNFGNLYINKSLLTKPDILKVILLHEASHLLPVGLNNNLVHETIFKSIQSETFQQKHKSIITKNKASKSFANGQSFSINPVTFKENPSHLLSNVLSSETKIDAQVLNIIKNDFKACYSYSESLYDANSTTSRFKRVKRIKDTCEYMKEHSFNYSKNTEITLSEKYTQIIKNKKALLSFILLNQEILKNSKTPKDGIELLTKLIFKDTINNIYPKESQEIMLKWYMGTIGFPLINQALIMMERDKIEEIN